MSEQQLKTIQDIKYGYAEVPTNEGATGEDNGGGRKLQLESIGDGQSYRQQIWGTQGIGETEAEGTGPYLPIWQMSPTLPLINLLNMNTLDLLYFTGPYSQVLSNGQASLGPMTHLDDPTDENGESVKVLNALLSQGQYRHELEEYARDPIASVGYPVFDSFAPDRKVVGILGSALYWRLLFKNVLPASGTGIVDVVIRNSFGQAETYRVEGPDASFVGEGDFHDDAFDQMEHTANIADYVASLAGPDSRSYTAVDLNSNYISYDIHIYPTQEMEANFVNNDPTYYALGVLGIFLFTVLVFLAYNILVARRHEVVMDKAVKSAAVVDSLFPANVQKRLYEEAEEVTEKSASKSTHNSNEHRLSTGTKKEWSNDATTKGRLTRFLSSSELVPENHNVDNSQPIADAFPEATVFFAEFSRLYSLELESRARRGLWAAGGNLWGV